MSVPLGMTRLGAAPFSMSSTAVSRRSVAPANSTTASAGGTVDTSWVEGPTNQTSVSRRPAVPTTARASNQTRKRGALDFSVVVLRGVAWPIAGFSLTGELAETPAISLTAVPFCPDPGSMWSQSPRLLAPNGLTVLTRFPDEPFRAPEVDLTQAGYPKRLRQLATVIGLVT